MKLTLFILLSLTVSSFANYTCADDFTTKDTCKTPCNWFDAATCTDNCAPQKTYDACSGTKGCSVAGTCAVKTGATDCTKITDTTKCNLNTNTCMVDSTNKCVENPEYSCTNANLAASDCVAQTDSCTFTLTTCSLTTAKACTVTSPNATNCVSWNGCAYQASNCTGAYQCTYADSTTCKANSTCLWTDAKCSVIPNDGCAALKSQAECTAAQCDNLLTDCTDVADFDCTQLDQTQCTNEQNNCAWNSGTSKCAQATACKDAKPQQCGQWTDSCSGTFSSCQAPACATADKCTSTKCLLTPASCSVNATSLVQNSANNSSNNSNLLSLAMSLMMFLFIAM